MKTINYNAIPDEIKERLDDCMIVTREIMDNLIANSGYFLRFFPEYMGHPRN